KIWVGQVSVSISHTLSNLCFCQSIYVRLLFISYLGLLYIKLQVSIRSTLTPVVDNRSTRLSYDIGFLLPGLCEQIFIISPDIASVEAQQADSIKIGSEVEF
ncbi:hypothetical protein, partial [Microcoleus sp. FACHB-1515]|uniref:hypothetical protein n=1 Tax=Cyanophyceae TaxID=3028117 RepID=UPI001A7E61C3